MVFEVHGVWCAQLVSARSELEFCLSEIQAELSACQQECREVKERAANAEDQLVSLNTRTAKVGTSVLDNILFNPLGAPAMNKFSLLLTYTCMCRTFGLMVNIRHHCYFVIRSSIPCSVTF